MTAGQIITYVLYFILFLSLQVLLFMHFSILGGLALCFVYLAFLLMLPYQISHVFLIFLAFGTGLLVDVFYNTNGIHAAATVLIAFLRPYIINFLTPRGGYDEGVDISISSLGFRWFVTYAAFVIVLHHLVLFVIWSVGFGNVLLTIGKTIASSAFTLLIVVLIQYLIHSPKRS